MTTNDSPPRARWLRSLLGPLVVLVAVWAVFVYRNRIEVIAPEEAPIASRLALRDAAGEIVELADYRGSVVVVNAWASWCGPCRAEIPGFSRVYADLRGEGLEVLGLNVDEIPPEQMDELRETYEINYPVLRVTEGFGGTFPYPRVIPHSWLIDREGRVRVSHSGYITESALRNAVRRLLDEP